MLNSDLNANKFGNKVTLANETDYTCQSDGYATIAVSNEPSNLTFAYLAVNGVRLIGLSANSAGGPYLAGYPSASIFVRKGMVLRASLTTAASASFVPIA